MIPENLPMGIFFFSQTTMGILGNWTILFHYLIAAFTGKRLMPKDQIAKHLAFANSLSIISRGIPQAMSQFGWKYFQGNLACKLIVYINRTSRAISLYATSLLSCYQAATINPANPRWIKLKHRASKYVGPSCSLNWFVHLVLNSRIALTVTGVGDSRNLTKKFRSGYCPQLSFDNTVTPLYLFILCFTDVLYLGLMVWASVSMVNVLFRHRRQVQYLHSAQHFPRVSPETRATQTILILVCTFVTFYSMTSILNLYVIFFGYLRIWLIHILTFLEACFPTFCPFILMSHNNSLSSICFPCCRKK